MEVSTFSPPTPPQQLRSLRLSDLGLWLLRQRQRFRVTGSSMQPLLHPGEEVLINPQAYRTALPQPGDLVVAEHPHQPGFKLIKWVVTAEPDGCFLKGLNETVSTDSRSFGLVPPQKLLGQVVCRFP